LLAETKDETKDETHGVVADMQDFDPGVRDPDPVILRSGEKTRVTGASLRELASNNCAKFSVTTRT
jgi:hypothetical protein